MDMQERQAGALILKADEFRFPELFPGVTRAMIDAGEIAFEELYGSYDPVMLVAAVYSAMRDAAPACQQ